MDGDGILSMGDGGMGEGRWKEWMTAGTAQQASSETGPELRHGRCCVSFPFLALLALLSPRPLVGVSSTLRVQCALSLALPGPGTGATSWCKLVPT